MSAVVTPVLAQILIVGNDEKQGWDENGKADLSRARQRHIVGHRHIKAGYAADHRDDSADRTP